MTKFTKGDFKRLAADLGEYAEEFQTSAEAELIRRTAEAFRQASEGKSLDDAFGQRRGRGRPKTGKPGKHFEIAQRVFHFRQSGLSWMAICREIEWQADQRDLQRILDRELPHVLADMAKRLARGAYSSN
jgi:hypothetical protein